jgi:hypothetical protein
VFFTFLQPKRCANAAAATPPPQKLGGESEKCKAIPVCPTEVAAAEQAAESAAAEANSGPSSAHFDHSRRQRAVHSLVEPLSVRFERGNPFDIGCGVPPALQHCRPSSDKNSFCLANWKPFSVCTALVMADDPGQDGKSLRPVRKSKQIAEDMRLAMMMANQLSKEIDKSEKVKDVMRVYRACGHLTVLYQAGASECKKKKAAAEAAVTPRSAAAPAAHSPVVTPSKKHKREDSG